VPFAESRKTIIELEPVLSRVRRIHGDAVQGGIPVMSSVFRQSALAIVSLAVSTVAAILLRPHLAAANLVMVYLLGVVAVAMRCSRQVAIVTSFISVAAFDFFCVPPYLTLRISDYQYLLTFAGMLVVALVISTRTAKIREQAQDAAGRERYTAILYRLSRRLAGEARIFDVARIAAECAEEALGARVVIFLPGDSGKISFERRTADRLPVSHSEETVAEWAFINGERAGHGTRNFGDSAALYLPLSGAHERFGVMAVVADGRDSAAAGQMEFLEVFANQTALAIERVRNQQAAEAARIRMQTEEMRSSLLSAVSHDLRTPLASITGAASTLRSQGDKLEPETRRELLESIADEAERLGRLVGNLLDMTRLESGVELHRDLCPLEEVVGAALQRMENQLGQRQVTTYLPRNLPLVSVDDVLLGQVFVNLLENAARYTSDGTEIEVAAEAARDHVMIEVRDRGPGFQPGEEQRVFEKFYRGKFNGARGAGLGLAICRAIIAAHHGEIEAFNRAGGGAVFQIRLPLERTLEVAP
jgi:two-component system sensor histidine kinase KdpD